MRFLDVNRTLVERFACPTVLFLVTVTAVATRLRAGAAALAFYDDDFFYYLKVAINIASGHGSTFDGLHLTNGYQPLWLWVLTGLAKLLSPPSVLLAVMGFICASTLLTYVLALACFRKFIESQFTASLVATAVAFSTFFLIRGGMEILLTLPLVLLFCAFRLRSAFEWNAVNAFGYGVIAALAVLSRLDAILLVMPVLAFETAAYWKRHLSLRAWPLLTVLVAAVPIAIYMFVNLHIFGVSVPISGLAKQLRIHHGFNSMPLKTIFFRFSAYARLLIVFPSIIVALLAAWRVRARGWGRLTIEYRPLVCGLLLFPMIHLAALCWLSDWPLWVWYLYTFVAAEVGAILVLATQERGLSGAKARWLQWGAAALLFFLMIGYAGGRIRTSLRPEGAFFAGYEASVAIERFSRDHPGIYAMGDRAGTPGYLMAEPLLQTEGLVMDRVFLQNVRSERDLLEVLRQYGVSYYVSSWPVAQGGCYLVREPAQAGPDSHVMRGRICQRPIARFETDGVDTAVFAVPSNESR